VDTHRAFFICFSRRDLVTQKTTVTGKQFEVPNRIAQLELEPTALVIFEDRQCPHLLRGDAAERRHEPMLLISIRNMSEIQPFRFSYPTIFQIRIIFAVGPACLVRHGLQRRSGDRSKSA
jgi:hypothetical protein